MKDLKVLSSTCIYRIAGYFVGGNVREMIRLLHIDH